MISVDQRNTPALGKYNQFFIDKMMNEDKLLEKEDNLLNQQKKSVLLTSFISEPTWRTDAHGHTRVALLHMTDSHDNIVSPTLIPSSSWKLNIRPVSSVCSPARSQKHINSSDSQKKGCDSCPVNNAACYE